MEHAAAIARSGDVAIFVWSITAIYKSLVADEIQCPVAEFKCAISVIKAPRRVLIANRIVTDLARRRLHGDLPGCRRHSLTSDPSAKAKPHIKAFVPDIACISTNLINMPPKQPIASADGADEADLAKVNASGSYGMRTN
jgi:hypothetical protein